jgi:8-hydroxy-5-deazaflavin:NADPH oxidoreductase
MKVGILGSGDVAKVLGTGFLTLGHEVMLGSRTPESEGLMAWKKGAGPKAKTGSFSDAAVFGEVLVVSTHGVDTENALRLAGPKNFEGKVVIDTTNPLVTGPDHMPQLAFGWNDSSGERVQKALPGAHVVKAFNTVGSPHMFRPKFPGGPPDMFYCGNDADAKKKVAEWLRAFGWNPLDVGGIEGARLLEPMCVLWVTLGISGGSWGIAFKLLHQ